jgi:hypothetical protein
MIPPSILKALLPFIEVLEDLNIPYQVGGSVASSFWGDPRATRDADVAADIQPEHIPRLVARLENLYYVDDQMILDAIRQRSSFNMLYLENMFKIDVFVRKHTAFDDSTFQRVQRRPTDDMSGRQIDLTSPEDTALHKLIWYRMGGGVSDRQWGDVLGVLKVQRASLDWEYMEMWAERLGIADLLERARQELAAQQQSAEES